MESVVLVKINAEKDDGRELMKEYSVPGYPTYIAMNAKGETILRWAGYMKEPFIARTAEVVRDPATIVEKEVRFAAKPTEADAATLARYNDAMGKYKEAIGLYRQAATLSGGVNGYRMEVFEATFTGYEEEMFSFDEVAAAGKEYFDAEKDPAELLFPARMMAYAGSKSGKPEIAAPFVKTAIDRTEGSTDPEVEKGRKRLLPDYAMIVLKDKKKAVAYKKDAMPEGWMDKSDALNSFAWWCFENNVNLEEAQELAERGVELAPTGSEKAQILDTLAEICNARGDCADAVAIMQRAIKEDPENEGYKKQLQRFQDLLAKGAK